MSRTIDPRRPRRLAAQQMRQLREDKDIQKMKNRQHILYK